VFVLSHPPDANRLTCELCRKLTALVPLALTIAFLLGPPALCRAAAPAGDRVSQEAAQPDPNHAEPAAGPKEAHSEAAEGEHDEGGGWGAAGKIVNFAILVGTLIYLLRAPVSDYLSRRRTQVRADLDAAEAMKQSAAAQIAEMEAKLKALPRELAELKARGQAEIAAEEARIRQLTEAERVRLVEQVRREIDQQVRMAQRALLEHAADLSVSVAEKKIKRDITDEDQARLVRTYLEQVKDHA